MTTGVAVHINGELIPGTWDGSDLLAVDDLRIRWGRSEPLDDPEPSLLTLQLVDRAQTFVTDPARIGQPVTVTIADTGRVVFRGRIVKPNAKRARILNPTTNRIEAVWLVTMTATDVLATLGMAIFAGDAIDGWIEGQGGWSETFPNNRLQNLWNAGASQLVPGGFDPVPDITASPAVRVRLHGEAATDARTALELVQSAYRTQPLAVASYDPHADRLTMSPFAISTPFALTLDGDSIVRLSPGAGLTIPASSIGTKDGYELESTVTSAIDVVQVAYFWYGPDPTLTEGAQKRKIWTGGFIEGNTARFDPHTRRVLKVDTTAMTYDPAEFVPGSRDPENRYPAWMRGQLIAIMNVLNGQPQIPTLQLDAKRLPLPPTIEAVLYRTYAAPVALYFPGSVYNGVPGVARQFQMIGGTLTYSHRKGWRHDITVCATGPAVPSTLDVAGLSASDTATVGDFDPDITIEDLGLVTTGLPA